jgi:hypothetical protein
VTSDEEQDVARSVRSVWSSVVRCVLLAVTGVALAGSAVWALPAVSAQTVPPGWTEVPGSPDAVLNPAHRGAQGSTFTQECTGNPFAPPAGGVLWHFILRQNDAASSKPDNIFVSLTVTFRSAGVVTLTTFGPPHAAHGWITTPTDDVLLDGYADGAERVGDGFPAQFNLSHTCASPEVVPPPAPTTSVPAPTTSVPPPLGSFPLAKQISGGSAGSQGQIVIEISCSPPNGSIPPFVIPPGATGVQTTLVTGVTTPATCTAIEVADGSETGVVAVLQDPAGRRGRNAVCAAGVVPAVALPPITLDNVVETTAVTVPEPTTTIVPEPPPGTVTLPPLPETTVAPPCPTVVLPPTGPSSTGGPTALLAVAALALGGALVLVARRRSGEA